MRATERARRYREAEQAERARESWYLVGSLYRITIVGGAALGAGLAYLMEAGSVTGAWWSLAGAAIGFCVGWLIRRASV